MLASLLASLALAAGDTAPAPPPRTLDELRTRIARTFDSARTTPGAAVAVVEDGRTVLAAGFGLARVAPRTPATAATLFRIGSSSKTLVAFVAMQLRDEGKLSLDDPIERHLPGFYHVNPWRRTDPVRIVHLLEHTSGWDDASLRAYADNDPRPRPLAEGLALDSARRVSRWRPGTRFAYCNVGPAVVARIIEVIEGRPFEAVVQARLLDPAGMRTATWLRPDTTRVVAATLYHPDGTTPRPYWHVFVRPAGSLNASALDMAAWLRVLTGRGTVDGRTLLADSSFARMEAGHASLAARAGLPGAYGLHLYAQPDTLGHTWIGHDGAVEGGLSDVAYLRGTASGYAVQTNADDGEVHVAIVRLVRGYLRRSLARPALPPSVPIAATVRERAPGWYVPVAPRQQRLAFLDRLFGVVRVAVDGDTLRVASPLDPEGSERYVAVDSLRFRSRTGTDPVLAFVRDAGDGRAVAIEETRGVHGHSLARTSAVAALGPLGLALAWSLASTLSLLVLVTGGARRLWRRLRGRATPSAPAAPLWRLNGAAVVALQASLAALGADIATIGRATPVSVGAWLAGIAFAVLTALAAVAALRRRRVEGWRDRLSLGAARVAVVLSVLGAAALVAVGYVGWRTWA